MTCDLYRDLAELLRDGALEGTEAADALAHRDACADCRAWEERTDAMLAPLSGFPTGPYLPPVSPWPRIPPWAGGSVTGSLLLAAALLTGVAAVVGAGRGLLRDREGAEVGDARSGRGGASVDAGAKPDETRTAPPEDPPAPSGTCAFQGRITGADGEGIPGARVSLGPVSAHTDAAGVFLLEGIPAGGARLLRVEPPGDPGFDALVPPLRGEGVRGVLAEMRAGPGAEGRVRVVGPAGDPVAGARVLALRLPGMLFPEPQPTYTPGPGTDEITPGWPREGGRRTDDAGFATLPGLVPGDWMLFVEAEGFATSGEEVPVGEDGALPRDVVLLPATTVEGLVIDATTGRPVPGAPVMAVAESRRNWFCDFRWTRFATSGPDGTFRIDGLPDQALRVSGRRPGSSGWTGVVSLEPGLRRGILVALPREIPVEALVVDEETGRPVAGVTILARSSGGGLPGATARELPAVTDSRGRIPPRAVAIGPLDAVLLAPVPGGPWVPASGHPVPVGTMPSPFGMAAPGPSPAPTHLRTRVEMARAGILEGVLRDPRGRVLPGRVLHAVTLQTVPLVNRRAARVASSAWTRADGSFRLKGVPPGLLRLRTGPGRALPGEEGLLVAGGPGVFECRPGELLTVELREEETPEPERSVAPPGPRVGPAPASVAGRIQCAEGELPPGIRLRWWVTVALPAGPPGYARMSAPLARIPGAVAADGSFRLEGLHPGSPGPGEEPALLLVAEAPGFAERVVIVPISAGDAIEGVRVELDRGSGCSGRLLRPDGSPAAGVPLAVLGGLRPGGMRAIAAEDGSFHLAGLPSDATHVVAGWPHETHIRWPLPGDGESATWTVPAPITLGGVVTDETGSPVAGHSVRWIPEKGVLPLAAVTGEDGSFRIGNVVGAGTLSAGESENGRTDAAFLPLRRSAPTVDTLDLLLRLERGAALSGLVEDDAGKPLGAARIGVDFHHGGIRGWRETLTAGDGSFRLDGLPPGDLELVIEREGAALSIPAAAGATGLRIRLPGGGGSPMAGTLMGSFGFPAEGMELSVRPEEGTASFGALAVTDHLGRFRLSAPGPGPLTVAIGIHGTGVTVRYFDGVMAAGDLRFSLGRSTGDGLKGRVKGSGGTPGAGLPVLAVRMGTEGRTHLDFHGDPWSASFVPPSRLRCVLSGPDGSFELGNPPGDWVVFAGFPGTAAAPGKPVVRSAGDRSPLELEIGEGRTLRFGVEADRPPDATRVAVILRGFLPEGAPEIRLRRMLGGVTEIPGVPAEPATVVYMDRENREVGREER